MEGNLGRRLNSKGRGCGGVTGLPRGEGKSILITIGTFRQPPNQIAGRSYSFDRTLTRKRGGIANGERRAARSQACVRISAIHSWNEYPNARSGAAPDSECVRGWAGEGICENPSSRRRCKGIRLQPSFRGGARGPFCACGFVDTQRAAPRRAYYGSIGFRHGAAERLEHSCDSNALRRHLRGVASVTGIQRLLAGCADSGSRRRTYSLASDCTHVPKDLPYRAEHVSLSPASLVTMVQRLLYTILTLCC